MRLSPVMKRHRIGALGLLGVIVAVGLLGPAELLISPSAAQPGPNIFRGNPRNGLAAARAEGENADVGEGLFLLPIEHDRDKIRRWEKAQQLIAQGYYSD